MPWRTGSEMRCRKRIGSWSLNWRRYLKSSEGRENTHTQIYTHKHIHSLSLPQKWLEGQKEKIKNTWKSVFLWETVFSTVVNSDSLEYTHAQSIPTCLFIKFFLLILAAVSQPPPSYTLKPDALWNLLKYCWRRIFNYFFLKTPKHWRATTRALTLKTLKVLLVFNVSHVGL